MKVKHKWITLSLAMLFLLCFDNSKAFALEAAMGDNASISGYVKDDKNKETLIGAVVSIPSIKRGAKTNKSGFYSVTNIPPGEYKVRVTYLGYEKFEKTITLSKSQQLRLEVLMQPMDIKSGTVTVTADREAEKREISVSKINVPMTTIKEIRIGGESDVFRSLQMLPGVLTSSQISSGLFVRGGSPDQNLVLLDGATVYNPTHIFGFISTFNTDAIKDVELIKGGFPAQYGGRLSAVLNMTQKDGNRENYEGNAALGIISSRASFQGPLFGNGSFFVSGRTTYFDLIKKAIDEDPKNPLPDFGFYDLNAKITQDIGSSNKVFLSGFMSKDNFGIDNKGLDMDLDLSNKLIAFRWNSIWDDNLFSDVNVSWSKYGNKLTMDNSGYKALIDNNIEDITAKLNVEWFVSDEITAEFGSEVNKYDFGYLQNFTGNTDSTASGSSGGSVNLKVNDWNYAAYTHWNWQMTELLSVQAGLRGYYWEQKDSYMWDPRFAIRYKLDETSALKFSWGLYHQNLRLSAMPDFSFFDTWLPTDSTVGIAQAIHYIVSYETKIFEDIDISFDLYYKSLANVSEVNMTAREGETVADVFEIGKANSYGFEVFLQKKIGRFTGWFGYAFGKINSTFAKINEGKEFHPKYDRTHDMKLVLQYSPNETWDFSANFTFQSGQSYTGATSRFQTMLPGENYGMGHVFPTQRYGQRLPASHQLNLSAGYNFKTFGLKSRLNLDIYNVYNHKDILLRYYDTQDVDAKLEDVTLLPIIPSISYEINF